jgi:hypothetical protein
MGSDELSGFQISAGDIKRIMKSANPQSSPVNLDLKLPSLPSNSTTQRNDTPSNSLGNTNTRQLLNRRYQIIDTIHTGDINIIYKAQTKQGQFFALKKYKDSKARDAEETLLTTIHKELTSIPKVKALFIECVDSFDEYCLFQLYDTNLHDYYLEKTGNETLIEADLRTVLQLFLIPAMEFLFKHKLCHGIIYFLFR